jgi:hypothetical protein
LDEHNPVPSYFSSHEKLWQVPLTMTFSPRHPHEQAPVLGPEVFNRLEWEKLVAVALEELTVLLMTGVEGADSCDSTVAIIKIGTSSFQMVARLLPCMLLCSGSGSS